MLNIICMSCFLPGVRPTTLRQLKLSSFWRCNWKPFKLRQVQSRRLKTVFHRQDPNKFLPSVPHENHRAGWNCVSETWTNPPPVSHVNHGHGEVSGSTPTLFKGRRNPLVLSFFFIRVLSVSPGQQSGICLSGLLGRWSKKNHTPAYSGLPTKSSADKPTFELSFFFFKA